MIHPTAYVDASAEIASDAEVGPLAYVGPNCIIHSKVTVSAKATVEKDTEVGEGTILYPNSHVGGDPQDISYNNEKTKLVIGKYNKIREFTNIHRATVKEDGITVIGDNNLFMAGVHIAHDCKIGNNIIMANCAIIAGHVHVDDFAFVGGLVGVHQFVHIGTQSMIAALSRVSKDVPPYCTVFDDSIVSMNVVGMRRRGVSAEARTELKRAVNIFTDKRILLTDVPEKLAELAQYDEVKVFKDFIAGSRRGITRNVGREEK